MKNKMLLAFNAVIIAVLAGCDGPSTEGRPVIVVKYYQEKTPCICRYYYNGLGMRQADFTDSCSKYDIGDTIK